MKRLLILTVLATLTAAAGCSGTGAGRGFGMFRCNRGAPCPTCVEAPCCPTPGYANVIPSLPADACCPDEFAGVEVYPGTMPGGGIIYDEGIPTLPGPGTTVPAPSPTPVPTLPGPAPTTESQQ